MSTNTTTSTLSTAFIKAAIESFFAGYSIQVHSAVEAWQVVNAILCELDANCAYSEKMSERAGYPVYRSADMSACYLYVCDLADRLEINYEGRSVNVWIFEVAAEDWDEVGQDETEEVTSEEVAEAFEESDDFDSIDLPDDWDEVLEQAVVEEFEGESQASETQVTDESSVESDVESVSEPFPFTYSELVTMTAAVEQFRDTLLDAQANCPSENVSTRYFAETCALVSGLKMAERIKPESADEFPMSGSMLVTCYDALREFRDKWLDKLGTGHRKEWNELVLHAIHDQAVKAHALMKKIDTLIQNLD